MALFSRKNLNNGPINELRCRIDEFIDELVANEDTIDKKLLAETLKKDNYQLAKEIYDLTHYSKEESNNGTIQQEEYNNKSRRS